MNSTVEGKPVLDDRRRHVRLGFDCPVRWNLGGADRTGWVSDVSESGLGFTTRALWAPRPGQRMQVTLELDGRHEWRVDEEAVVVRCEPRGHHLYSVGLELSQPFQAA